MHAEHLWGPQERTCWRHLDSASLPSVCTSNRDYDKYTNVEVPRPLKVQGRDTCCREYKRIRTPVWTCPPFSPWIPHLDEQRRQPGSPSFGISRRSKPPKALSAYLNTHVATPNHWRNLGLSPLLALLVIWDLLEKPACPALLETSSP